MADIFGKSRIPLYVMNVAYPVIDEEIQRFCQGKKAILVIEEGQPEYHEQAIHTVLGRAQIRTLVHGKDVFAVHQGTDLRPTQHRVYRLFVVFGLAFFNHQYGFLALAKPLYLFVNHRVSHIHHIQRNARFSKDVGHGRHLWKIAHSAVCDECGLPGD